MHERGISDAVLEHIRHFRRVLGYALLPMTNGAVRESIISEAPIQERVDDVGLLQSKVVDVGGYRCIA
jgi:hypothetical protein